VVPLAGTETGRAELARGAGGDRTMELDRAAEAAAFAELDKVASRGEKFSVLSEEAGLISHGAEYPLVLVDPVDGSLNARQGVPFFAVMLALLDGPLVGDTVAGCVVNLISGETWTAVRKQGASHSGRPLAVMPREDENRIGLVALESTPRSLSAAHGLVESASKIRILGSMALAIAHTAGGAFDAFCAPIPMRVFDMAASLLVLEEAGGVSSDLNGHSLSGLPCTLESRTSLVCAPNRALHAAALEALSASR
jgi:myo-inositol-1(or 4)-monophosphatase